MGICKSKKEQKKAKKKRKTYRLKQSACTLHNCKEINVKFQIDEPEISTERDD